MIITWLLHNIVGWVVLYEQHFWLWQEFPLQMTETWHCYVYNMQKNISSYSLYPIYTCMFCIT